MRFIDRRAELERLSALGSGRAGALAVLWGRRRVGKTRLLLEWCRRAGGVYVVCDQSAPEVQRAFVAEALASRLPGFADVVYPDWRRLFERVARDARAIGFRGPLALDELPYLVLTSPELPSVLQAFVDHAAREAGLRVAVAGSSQRMMQGLALDASAPLYGRAEVLLDLPPLAARHLPEAFAGIGAVELVETWTAWGGIPRYWELASAESGTTLERLERLVLDPMGALHSEPERILLEEAPSAMEVRPVLDAIGAGAHRLSEIGGRLGRPATSLARPIDRLVSMRMVRRETPFGEPVRGGKKSLYRIDDPFLRLWFRVVAPRRAELVAGSAASRSRILAAHWDRLVAEAWEELCRAEITRVAPRSGLGRAGPWRAAQRWWQGTAPEWDLVAESVDGERVLLGEARFSRKAWHRPELEAEAKRLHARSTPEPIAKSKRSVMRALFVPAVAKGAPRRIAEVEIVTVADLLGIRLKR